MVDAFQYRGAELFLVKKQKNKTEAMCNKKAQNGHIKKKSLKKTKTGKLKHEKRKEAGNLR